MLKLKSIIASVFALLIVVPAAWADEAVTLVYTNFFPPTHVQSKLADAWCKEVEKKTQGKVKFRYLPGQSLVKAGQGFEAVTGGIADLAMDCFAYTRGRFPVMEAVDLPMGYTSGPAATKVVNQVASQLKPKELAGVEVMYLHAHGPALLHTKKKAVRTLEDLKGLKIRAQGGGAKVVKALGGTPVAMPMPESYQALAKGVVDGAVYPVEANLGWKLGEVNTFCTINTSMAPTTSFFVVMNQGRWMALPEAAKKAIREINRQWAVKHGKAWDESDQKGRDFFLSQKGRQMIELSPEEAARWKKAVQPVVEDYIQRMGKRRINGKAVVKAVRQALKEHASQKSGS